MADENGFWAKLKHAKLLVGLVTGALGAIATSQLVCARAGNAKTDPKTAATASSGAMASPTATASPNITVSPSLAVTVPPPASALPQPAPSSEQNSSDNGGISVGGDNYGQINGPGAHHNSQKIYQGADKEEVRKVRAELEAIREYSDMARLTAKGLPLELSGGGDIVFSSPLSDSMKPAFEGTHFKCDPPAIEALQRTKSRYPRFPFSYYGLAYCASISGGDWREDAAKAKEIFEKTTTIAGHVEDHDRALKEINASSPYARQ